MVRLVIRPVVGGGLLLLLAACPPEGERFHQNCSGGGIAAAWHCEASLQSLKTSQSLSFSSDSAKHEVQLTALVAVARGSVRVEVKGSDGVAASRTVRVGKPASVDLRVLLNRPGGTSKPFFRITFDPLEGAAEGLAVTLDYGDPPSK